MNLSDNNVIAEAHAALEEAIVKGLRSSGELPEGWSYKDFPTMKLAYWQYLLEGFGENGKDYRILATSGYLDAKGEHWARGQLLLSPEAIENLRVYMKTHPIPV